MATTTQIFILLTFYKLYPQTYANSGQFLMNWTFGLFFRVAMVNTKCMNKFNVYLTKLRLAELFFS